MVKLRNNWLLRLYSGNLWGFNYRALSVIKGRKFREGIMCTITE